MITSAASDDGSTDTSTLYTQLPYHHEIVPKEMNQLNASESSNLATGA
jgi:hypothetical protein